MFDINSFKKKCKLWIEKNPSGEKKDFLNFCKSALPQKQNQNYSWLTEEASMWFESMKSRKKTLHYLEQEEN